MFNSFDVCYINASFFNLLYFAMILKFKLLLVISVLFLFNLALKI